MLLKFKRNTLGRDFVVGDIHGCFDRLWAFLNKLGFDHTKDRLFSVGDLTDRGANNDQVLDALGQSWFHAVRGNHCQMTIDANDPYNTTAQGSLLMNGGGWYFCQSQEFQKELAFSYSCLPFAIEVDTPNGKCGIVHADVPYNDWDKMVENLCDPQVQRHMVWDRTRISFWEDHDCKGVDFLVVGHNVTESVVRLGNVWSIDTGAVFLGKYPEYDKGFTILNLMDMEIHYETQT